MNNRKFAWLTDGDATDCNNMASFQAEVVGHLLAVSPLGADDQAILRDTLLEAPGQVPQDELLAQRILGSLLAYLQPRASLSRLEETVVCKLVRRLHQESDNHDHMVRVGEEVVPNTSTATTGKELMRVDAPPMGADVQTGNKNPTGHMTQASSGSARHIAMQPKVALPDGKTQSFAQAGIAGGKNVKQEHPGQAPTANGKAAKQEHPAQDPYSKGNSVRLSDYVEGSENEQPYQFGMKHMQKQGWNLGEGLGPQGHGIREFLQPIQNVEHSKHNNRAGLRSDEAPNADKDRNQQSSHSCIHKETADMPDGKRYDVTSTPRQNPNAGAEYGEVEWQSAFPHDDPYLKKRNRKHAAWAKNGW